MELLSLELSACELVEGEEVEMSCCRSSSTRCCIAPFLIVVFFKILVVLAEPIDFLLP